MPAPVLLLASAAAPVVDIDGTIFIQAGIFLLLMAILHPLLFKPWLATRARREHAIDGTLLSATELRVEAERIGVDYDARLADARGRAGAVRSEAVKAAESDRQRRLADTRSAANVEMEELRGRLARESDAARSTLAARVDELAADVATRILGRTP
ncbi:ATP synthase F0 subunit B [Nannocystis sp.]|uniref:ATP synthase F0 subunit B n=1 Tax=Nannocystis sp. TaxID=1962667 RepID=UPI0024295249|nr:ATP synthase F0 subunit B [Nannocystis sp.]MBK7823732.1 ATP synthase F0 subunit B [Nannocystis sp.]MBK9755746.1 ATP synthase F0 subunit B [Nannocystis sp.]